MTSTVNEMSTCHHRRLLGRRIHILSVAWWGVANQRSVGEGGSRCRWKTLSLGCQRPLTLARDVIRINAADDRLRNSGWRAVDHGVSGRPDDESAYRDGYGPRAVSEADPAQRLHLGFRYVWERL